MKDAIDQDRYVLGGLTHAQARDLAKNLMVIMPDAVVWTKEV